MYYVYLLELNHPEKRYYIGSTPNLTRRYKEHQNGLSEFTKSKLPIKLIYYECYTNKNLALKR